MNKKSFFTILCCLLCGFILISCNNFFDDDGNTSLSVYLPYGSENARAAGKTSYDFKIKFIHSSGTENIFEGSSGDKIELNPAEVGDYIISGIATNDKGEVIYEGETKTVVTAGKETKVSLTMDRVVYEVEAATKHMTLTPDRKGVKITLNSLSGEANWDLGGSIVTEKTSGLRMEISEMPKPGEPLVIYYPFTKKGEKYDFNFHLTLQEMPYDYIDEENASCTAGGGDDSYFSSFDETYYNTRLILDSENYSVKLSRDMLTAINQEKVDNGEILNMGVFFNLYAGNQRWTNTIWACYDLLTKYSQTGMPIEYDNLFAGGYSLSANHTDALEIFKTRHSWWADYAIRFQIKNLPDQHFQGPLAQSDLYNYSKAPESLSSNHVTVEPDPKGIKVTFKWLEGDGDWRPHSRLISADYRYTLDFENNVPPSSVEPTKTYYIAYTDSGEYYDFNFDLFTSTNESFHEILYSKAGGGYSTTSVNIPEKWSELSMDSSYVLKYYGNDLETMFKPSTFSGTFDYINMTMWLFSGMMGSEGSIYVASSEYPIYDPNEGGDRSSNLAQLTNGIDIKRDMSDYEATTVDYKLGSNETYSAKVRFNFIFAGTNTYLTMNEMQVEKPYNGTSYGKYIEEERDLGDNWSFYYSCLESKKPILRDNEIDTNSFVFQVEMADDYSNYFECQLRQKFVSTRTGNVDYGGDLTGPVGMGIKLFILDNNKNLISGVKNLQFTGEELQVQPSANVENGKTYYYVVQPTSSGRVIINSIMLY